MIIDPDFLTHWRTQMLIDELDGDEMAPIYLIRIWGHCQSRRSATFDMPSAGLKALCRYRGDAEKFEAALISSGFLERDGKSILVPKWLEHNASLTKNWENGGKGGRPKRTQEEPSDNPNETQEEHNDNPNETQEEPNDNPRRTLCEPIREDKRREETTSAPNDSANRPEPEKPAEKKHAVAFADGKFSGINGFAAVWRSAYPAVDIDTELAKAAAWLVANPKNRKSNYARFLTNWLSRAQDRAPPQGGGQSSSLLAGVL